MSKIQFQIIRDKYDKIDVEQTLFEQRHIFINKNINPEHSDEIIKKLLVLDMDSDRPIQIYITSPGGHVDWGFAIIDVMKQIRSKVITIANGNVSSMGALILISGDERKCFKNTSFMFHDLYGGIEDYSQKIKARAKFYEKLYDKLEKHILQYTKLDKKDVEIFKNQELWLFAEEALEKGVVDKIIQ